MMGSEKRPGTALCQMLLWPHHRAWLSPAAMGESLGEMDLKKGRKRCLAVVMQRSEEGGKKK